MPPFPFFTAQPTSGSNSKPIARFGFEEDSSDLLGTIHRPVVTIRVWSDTYRHWQAVRMLVDTGADYSIFPRYMATLLGIQWQKLPVKETLGIGGRQEIAFIDQLKIKIGSVERIIPAGFIASAKTPALLGRHLCFETFRTVFNQNQELLFFE
jgi:predicted aspartyl protease